MLSFTENKVHEFLSPHECLFFFSAHLTFEKNEEKLEEPGALNHTGKKNQKTILCWLQVVNGCL